MLFLLIIFSQLQTLTTDDALYRYRSLNKGISIDSQFNMVPDFGFRLGQIEGLGGEGTLLFENSDTLYGLTTDFGVNYQVGNLTLFVEPVAKFGDDGLYPTNKFKGVLRSDFKRAYFSLTENNWKILVGRLPLHIGESPRFRLLFDKNGPPIEILGFFVKTSKLMFYVLYSQLERMRATPTSFYADSSDSVWGYRYLSLHGVDFYPTDWMRLGFKEVVLWGGPNSQRDWFYLNPLTLYYTHQFNHPESKGNILWLLSFRLVKKMIGSIYGEFLIDDYQYAPGNFNEPNSTGLILGVEGSKLIGTKPIYSLFEYTRITRWVYNHKTPFTRWTYMGIGLGHPWGPDLEMYYGTIMFLGERFSMGVEAQNIKKGEAKIFSPWPLPGRRARGYRFPDDNFLTGNVKVSDYIGLLTGYRVKFISINARLGVIKPVKPASSKQLYLSFELTWGITIRP